MTKEEMAYMAGIVDGEGCIGANVQTQQGKKYHYLRIEIANTNEALPKYLKEISGLGNIYYSKQQKVNWKRRISWVVTGNEAEKLILDILPYLIIKKQQAFCGLKLRDSNRRKDVKGSRIIGHELNLLNKKGVGSIK